MRALVAMLLTACILLPGLAAAQSASNDNEFSHAILDIAISADGTAMGIAMVDDGSVTSLDPDQDTWFLMKVTDAGLDVVQRGDVDPAVCDDDLQVSDTCGTDAQHIAISATGARLAVAGQVDASRSVIVLVDSGGVVRRDEVTGTVRDIVMSDDGKVVFAAVDRSIGGGTMYRYAWGQTISRWDQEMSGDPGALAIAPGGAVAYARNGGALTAYTQSETSSDDDPNFPGQPVSMAVSDSTDRITIVGGSSGDMRIYDDDSIGANRAQLNILSSRGSLREVGISEDASRIMAGWADGTVHVYQLKHDPILLGSRILTQAVPGLVDAQLSRDGQTLLLVTGDAITMVDVDTGTALWSDAFSDAKAAMAGDGGRVIASQAGTLRTYDAISDIHLALPHPGPLMPGDQVVLNMTVENAGNRVEDITLSVEGPAWATSLSATEARLLPGASQSIQLAISVPAGTAAGAYDITVTADGSKSVSTVLEAEVPAVARFAVNTTGPHSLAVDAGSAAVFTFPAVNIGNTAGQPSIRLDVPTDDWSGSVLSGAGVAQPGQEFEIQLALAAPEGAAELAVGQLNAEIEGVAVNLTATVGARFGVSWSGPNAINIAPGNSTIFQMTVRNDGNAPDSFRLTLGSVPHAWNFAFDDGSLLRDIEGLAPGASKKVLLKLQAPVTASGPALALGLQAQSLADPEQTAARTVLAHIDVPVVDVPTGEEEAPDKESPAPFVAPFLLAGALWRRRQTGRTGP